MDERTQSITVVCHVRAPLLFEPVDRQIETLTTCEGNGTIDDLLMRSWPKEVRVDEQTTHHEVLETYDRCQRWARERALSIEPPFTTRTRSPYGSDRTQELLVTPLCCLEVYADDDLVGIFPHTDGEKTATTETAIAALRTGTLPTPLSPPTPTTRGPVTTCPDCEGRLINGQGLFACLRCGWTGSLTPDGTLIAHTPATRSVDPITARVGSKRRE